VENKEEKSEKDEGQRKKVLRNPADVKEVKKLDYHGLVEKL